MPLDLTTLRFIVTVADTGSIAQAAKKERISPSAISRRISDAEVSLGVPLFERTTRGLIPTHPARTLVAHGRRVLRDLHVIEQDISGKGETIRVASTMSAVCRYLPSVLRHFSGRYPDVSFHIDELNSDDIAEGLRDRQYDIGIGFWNDARQELRTMPFVVDPLGIIMLVDHPLASRESLAFEDVLPLELVGMRSGSDLERLMEQEALRAGVQLLLKTRVAAFDAVLQMVGAGMGLAIVPMGYVSLIGDPSSFRAVPLVDKWAARQMKIMLPRSGYVSERTQLLVRTLKSEYPPA